MRNHSVRDGKSRYDYLRSDRKTPEITCDGIPSVDANGQHYDQHIGQQDTTQQQRPATLGRYQRGRGHISIMELQISEGRIPSVTFTREPSSADHLPIAIEARFLLPRSPHSWAPPARYTYSEGLRTVRRVSAIPSLFAQFSAGLGADREVSDTNSSVTTNYFRGSTSRVSVRQISVVCRNHIERRWHTGTRECGTEQDHSRENRWKKAMTI